MSELELEVIEATILAREARLAAAEATGKDALIVMYGNNLTELQKSKIILLTGTGNSLSYR